MKKAFMMTIVLLCAVAQGAWAQWQPSDTEYTRLTEEGTSAQYGLHTLATADGKTIVTWVVYSRETMGYQLYLQILDAQGYQTFAKGGITLNSKPTPTDVPNYAIALAPNGDILLAYNDSRDGHGSRYYLYRYTQTGQPVWSADGVAFQTKSLGSNGDDESATESDCALVCQGDNIFFAVCRVEEKVIDGSVVNERQWQVKVFNANGEVATPEPLCINSLVMYLLPAPDGDVYAIYDTPFYNVLAQRLDATLTDRWDEPVEVDWDALNKDITYRPHVCVDATADGGVAMAYNKVSDSQTVTVFNYLSPDGKVISNSQAPAIGDIEDGRVDDFIMATSGNTSIVLYVFAQEGIDKLRYNAIGHDGHYLWDATMTLSEHDEAYSFEIIDIIPQDDGWVLVYGKGTAYATIRSNFYITKIGLDGTTLWTKQILPDEFSMNASNLVTIGQYAHLYFTENINFTTEGPFLLTTDITNANTGIQSLPKESVSEGAEANAWYTLDGHRLPAQPSCAGIYINKGIKILVK
mgnify:CR=1 FL=1